MPNKTHSSASKPPSTGDDRRDGRSLRWQSHRESRRTELINAGIAAVREYGPDLSVEQIADKAGTSRAVIYRHFTDKTDLYVAIGKTVADMFVAQLARALAAVDDLEQGIAVGVEVYLQAVDSDPSLYRFTVRHPLLSRSGRDDPAATASEVLAGFLSSRFGDLLRAAGGDSGAAEPWGYGLVGLVRTTGEWWMERRTMSRAALAHHLSTLIWSGVVGALPSAPQVPHAVAAPAPGSAGPPADAPLVRLLRIQPGA